VPKTFRYDVLISYRRQEPDKAFARDLLRKLEADGYTVAIDERDFAPPPPRPSWKKWNAASGKADSHWQ
jgi:hypothetical protein